MLGRMNHWWALWPVTLLLGACTSTPPPPFEGDLQVPTGYAVYSAQLEPRTQIVPHGGPVPDQPTPLREWLGAANGTAENTFDARTLRIELPTDQPDPGDEHAGPLRHGLARSSEHGVHIDLFDGAIGLEALSDHAYLVRYRSLPQAIWDSRAGAFLPFRVPRSIGGVAVLQGGVAVTMSDGERRLQLWDRDGEPLPVPESMARWGIGSINGLLNGRLVMLTTPPLVNNGGGVVDATWAWAPGREPVMLWRGGSVMRIAGGDQQFVSAGTKVRRVEIDPSGAIRVTTMRGVRSMRISPDDRALATVVRVYDPGFKGPILRETYWNLAELTGDRARTLARGLRFEGWGCVWLHPDSFGGPVTVRVVPRAEGARDAILPTHTNEREFAHTFGSNPIARVWVRGVEP